jgi:NTE family protein
LREELEPELGRELRLDVLSGTSVGAIHACYLGATAGEGAQQARLLTEHWLGMKVDEVLGFGYRDVVRFVREIMGSSGSHPSRHGGLVDPRGLRAIVGSRVPWLQIGRNLRRGVFSALSVSTTHVASGTTLTFIQRAGGGIPPWGNDPHFRATAAAIGPKHALASAAIPLIFPVVKLHGELFVDGSLRMNVPLSPALRLGARRVVVVSLRPKQETPADNVPTPETSPKAAMGPFLMGKALNALLVDRTDQDLDRLKRLNSLLEAGTRAFGPGFAHTLNEALVPHRNQQVRYVRTLLVRPSRDVAALALEYARSPEFKKSGKGLGHRAILTLAERGADLASYLLFDGGFARLLIDLGRADARARRPEWIRFWSEAPECASEAAEMGAGASAA